MLLGLIEDPRTDIIGALEAKLETSSLVAKFHEDTRVHSALKAWAAERYDLEPSLRNMHNQFRYLDDAWVMTYLMKHVGQSRLADATRSIFHKGYDPYTSYNPVVKGFAYCEAIESAASTVELEDISASMVFHVGQSDDSVLRRVFPVLKGLYDKKHSLLKRREMWLMGCQSEIDLLVKEGDSLTLDWNFSDASERYSRASEIARYHLNDPGYAEELQTRMKSITDRMLDKDPDPVPGDEVIVEKLCQDRQEPVVGRQRFRGSIRYIHRGVARCYEGARRLFKKKGKDREAA